MIILTDNIIRIGYNSTIGKLVVILILLYKHKAETGIKMLGKWTPLDSINYVICNKRICQTP